jgi:hypothetical protein
MNHRAARFRRFAAAGLVSLGALLLFATVPAAFAFDNPEPVGLAAAGAFSVLGASTVTNAGDTVVSGGDLGVSPGSAVTGFPPGVVTPPGTIHAADGVASTAQDSAATAYNDAATRSPSTVFGPIHDLTGETFTAGVYNDPSSFGLTGTVTLDAEDNPDAVFIFQAGSTLITSGSSSVALTNGAQACNVFWQVGSSATLGAGSSFNGTILALTSISVGDAANVDGRLLAGAGAVTLINDAVHTSACAPLTGVAQAPLLGSAGPAAAAGLLAVGAGVIVVRRRMRPEGVSGLCTERKVAPCTQAAP